MRFGKSSTSLIRENERRTLCVPYFTSCPATFVAPLSFWLWLLHYFLELFENLENQQFGYKLFIFLKKGAKKAMLIFITLLSKPTGTIFPATLADKPIKVIIAFYVVICQCQKYHALLREAGALARSARALGGGRYHLLL
jgi:hypothetical protein